MREEAFLLGANGARLFTVVYRPECRQQSLAFVVCPPFYEERVIAQRPIVSLARTLSSQGYACLRQDYFGSGDSEGLSEELTMERAVSDLSDTLKHVQQEYGMRVNGVIGMRYGAAIACRILERYDGLRHLILIDPISEGLKYFNECLRANLATQLATFKKIVRTREQLLADLGRGETINSDGYHIGKAMYSQMQATNLIEQDLPKLKSLLVVENKPVTRGSDSPPLRSWCERHAGRIELTRYATVQNEMFWRDSKISFPAAQAIQAEVMAWLEGVL